MNKTYVLDTNVLIQSPSALLSFEENNIVLPSQFWKSLTGTKQMTGSAAAAIWRG